ncbi:phosphotransferase [Microbacterium sp. MYb66]|jgi:aminoglycoside phosphotransferase (APT) family kinase protein|uniref:phosphotransferase n=1 Tax=Microbacterium sp. MYb66 TaxID=1848692 RepID=UPI000D00A1BA|nr:phosphotransferase [Microbacterium sp. MYb66]PRA82935.1 hypothetical protein CQ045_00575 [Microbacterium sp. MYb66]
MHERELALDDALAARLIQRRFPELSGQLLRTIGTTGTVNRIIRVGDEHVARFPLLGASETDLVAEADALAELAAAIPFPAPRPYGVAPPSEDFVSAWSVQSWLDGDTAEHDSSASSESLAADVGLLISSLRAVDVRGRSFDGRGRGGRLSDHEAWVMECLARSAHLLDVPRATALWRRVCVLPEPSQPAMSHRDLTPFNLLVAGRGAESRLVGVLDGGGFGPADPALDLVAAWHLFDAPARQVLRRSVGAEDVEWLRGAGWALQQALGLGWYYADSNPAMSALGLSTVLRLLTDAELSTLID